MIDTIAAIALWLLAGWFMFYGIVLLCNEISYWWGWRRRQ